MHVVSVVNRKGGSGKTTLAVNLAAALYRRTPTVLVDADEQGSAAKWLGEGVPVVRACSVAELRRGLRRPGPGVVIADGPPFNAEINRALYQLADLVIVPVRPSALDLDAARPILEALAQNGRRGLAVLSQVDGRAAIQREARDALAGYGVPVAPVALSMRVAHARAVLARQPVITYRPSSPATFEVNELADYVADLLGV